MVYKSANWWSDRASYRAVRGCQWRADQEEEEEEEEKEEEEEEERERELSLGFLGMEFRGTDI